MYSLILTHLLLRLLDHLFYDSVVDPLGLAVHALADVSASQQALIRCGGEERSLVEVGAGELFCAPPVPGACTRTRLRCPCQMSPSGPQRSGRTSRSHRSDTGASPYRNVGDLDATWLGKRIALFFSRQECFTELLAGLGQVGRTPIFSMSLRAQHLDASSSRLILLAPV